MCWFAQKSACSCKHSTLYVLSPSNLLYASNVRLTWLVQRTKQKEATFCCFYSRFQITFTAQEHVLQHTAYNTKYTIRFHTFITYLYNISTPRSLNKRNTLQAYNITFACKRHVSPRLSYVYRSSEEFGRQIDSNRCNSTRSEREGNSYVIISLLRNGRGRGTRNAYTDCVSLDLTGCVQYSHSGMRRNWNRLKGVGRI